MQVSVETTEGLERKMRVEVPAQRIDEAVEKKLKAMAPQAKVKGFRPGKVPQKVIEQKYGQDVRQEVVLDVINETWIEAVKQENLKPAGRPNLEPTIPATGENLVYIASFEVFPEFTVKTLEGETVEKVVSNVSEDDVNKMIEQMREQHKVWEPVERHSKDGDQVNINFEGFIDGEPLEGGKAENFDLELGHSQMIPGFEEGLTGAKAGEERELKLTFPAEYHHNEVAGKDVVFNVVINSVKASSMPEINEEFTKNFGIEGGADELNKSVSERMQRQLDNQVKMLNKKAVFDKLVEVNEVDVPSVMIKDEIQRAKQELMQQFKLENTDQSLPDELFKEQAERSAKLGLLLSQLIDDLKIKSDSNKVRELIESMAGDYESPEEYVKWYYQDQNRLRQAENMVIEEQIFQSLFGQAKTTDKQMTYQEVMNPKSAEPETEKTEEKA